MVDAENLLFLEILAHVVVDLPRRGQVVAQRLFQHHARVRVDEAGAGQVGTDAHEQAGRGGQVVHAVGAGLQGGAERGVVGRLRGVEGDVVQPLQKALPRGHVVGLGLDEAGHFFLDEFDEGGAVPGLAAQRVDARGGGQVVVQVRHVQRGQQLAHREVAHPAKDHQIEWRSRGGGGRGGGHVSNLVTRMVGF
ncbi:hypothetical protein D9M68_696440 [compost metagenome]